MNFEDLQNAWQSQNEGAKMTIDADVLLREVRRNQWQFRTMIFARDVREAGVCALMTVGFLAWGLIWKWWSLDLLALCCFGVGAFFVVDRLRQRRKQPVKNDSLRACIESSLSQVNHQIWLLKNIFWWYLLPILLGLGAVTGSTIWSHRQDGAGTMIMLAGVLVFTYGFTFWVVYRLNQKAVRNELDPRRQELEALLSQLK